MGLLLFLVATILWVPMTVLNVSLVVSIKAMGGIKGMWQAIDGYFLQTAIDIDRFANRNFRTFWNATLIVDGGYGFGDVRETVSSVLGKNQRDGTLSRAGRWLAWLLDWIDEDHCEKSIMEFDDFKHICTTN